MKIIHGSGYFSPRTLLAKKTEVHKRLKETDIKIDLMLNHEMSLKPYKFALVCSVLTGHPQFSRVGSLTNAV